MMINQKPIHVKACTGLSTPLLSGAADGEASPVQQHKQRPSVSIDSIDAWTSWMDDMSDLSVGERAVRLRFRKWVHLLVSLVLLIALTLTAEINFPASSGVVPLSEITVGLSVGMLCVGGFVVVIQVIFGIGSFLLSLRDCAVLRISDVWIHYTATALNFGAIYYFLYMSNPSTFAIAESTVVDVAVGESGVAFEVCWVFIYFSFATQTLVGFGDVAPFSMLSCFVSTLQMCLAVLYTSVFVAQTLSTIEQAAKADEEIDAVLRVAESNGSIRELCLELECLQEEDRARAEEENGWFEAFAFALLEWGSEYWRSEAFQRGRRILRRHVLLVVIATNGVFVTMLAALSPRLIYTDEEGDSGICHVIAGFMLLQAVLVIMVSFKYVSKSNKITLGSKFSSASSSSSLGFKSRPSPTRVGPGTSRGCTMKTPGPIHAGPLMRRGPTKNSGSLTANFSMLVQLS